MRNLSARRLMPTGIIAAAGVVALMAPGAASASLGEQCSGPDVHGQGSTLQNLAQGIWNPGFNVSTEKHACNGSQGTKATPKITYTGTGSGPGEKTWGVEPTKPEEVKFDATNGFIATDEAPNPTAKKEIEEHETTLTPKALLTIPVLQAAVAIIVHLPEKCVATSTSNKGRLVLNNSTLEKIERGTITKWSEIKDGGDTITGTGCNAEETIKHIVRKGGSGTTHILKKYLGLIDNSPWPATNEKGETVGEKTWGGTAEGGDNPTWPTADAVTRASGGSGVVSAVATTPSSVGYANVADARANAAFVSPSGGPKTATFWVPIQNKTAEPVTYADPASNKEVATKKESNCVKEEYTDGVNPFPPENAQVSWSEVTTRVTEPKYTICGLTFVLAFTNYGSFPGTTIGEATTANNYLQFVTSSKGGQLQIKGNDYEPLNGTVLKEAQKGSALVGF
jgi:ABC-type phosphate transport system substrate-binding protein